MRISIVGCGPVGLLIGCLLASRHKITLYEKRDKQLRDHGLDISSKTTKRIIDYIKFNNNNDNIIYNELISKLEIWSSENIKTSEIQETLKDICIKLGCKINTNSEITKKSQLKDSIVIGADGANSQIRKMFFDNEIIKNKNLKYMAQLKFMTPVKTRSRLSLSSLFYSLLNSISGSDIVLDFESLGSSINNTNKDHLKHGTLHIPIPKSTYDMLSSNGRGKFDKPLTLNELKGLKLYRVIKRYEFSLWFRNGQLIDPKITLLPLSIYKSKEVAKFYNDDKLVILAGDSSSGLIYQRGLNKGWLEAVECCNLLGVMNCDIPVKVMDSMYILDKFSYDYYKYSEYKLNEFINNYSNYCQELYNTEILYINNKHNKIYIYCKFCRHSFILCINISDYNCID